MESCNGMCANIKWEQILIFKNVKPWGQVICTHTCTLIETRIERRQLHNISLDIKELQTFFGNIL